MKRVGINVALTVDSDLYICGCKRIVFYTEERSLINYKMIN